MATTSDLDSLLGTNLKTVTFGSHKGKTFQQLPIEYLRWMIKHHSFQWHTAQAELERRIKGEKA